ncbi:class I SAM-dependent methyltransferase [Sulfurimonas sp.]|uniref:class I SAM-dependent methyltransferase n=1 Tax=Sulfurimonas sp. TaxID=2022749 RepID=UPI003D0C4375
MPKINNEIFYKNAIKKYGTTAQGLNWNSQIHQVLRFYQIIKLLPQNLNDFTLSDVGCGFGDFYNYLDTKPKKYIGIDVLEEMLNIAKNNTGQEVQKIDLTQQPSPTSDYIVCSGALNILTRFETTMFIQNCYNSAKKGFIFNCLYGNKESETFNYLDEKFLEDIALFLKVNKVNYIKDYIPNDLTIGFFR